MTCPITIDLDSILTGADYDETVGGLFRDALRAEIAKYIKSAVANSPDLKRALAALQADAVRKIIAATGGKP